MEWFVGQNPPHLCPAKNIDHTVYIYVSKDQKLFNKKLIRSIQSKSDYQKLINLSYCVTYLCKQEIAQYKS